MPSATLRPARPIRLARFFAVALATALLLLGCVALLNVAVNPLFLYRDGATALPGAVRDRFGDYMRLAKPHAIADLAPTGIVFGNSRALYGYDPTDPLFGPRGYNGALAGTGLVAMRELLWHALAVASPKMLVLVFDPSTSFPADQPFSAAQIARQELSSYATLAATSDGGGSPLFHWLEGEGLLFSALQAQLSIETISGALGWRRVGGDYRADGQRAANFGDAEIARLGQRAMFLGYLRRHAPSGGDGALDTTIMPAALAVLDQMVRHVYEADPERRLIVVFEPLHASVYAAGGMSRRFDRASAVVATVAGAVDAASRGRAESWDCSGYNPMMAEPIPPAESRTHEMRWWWDASHYTAAFGGMILDQIAGRAETGACTRLLPRAMDAYARARAAQWPLVLAAGRAAVGDGFDALASAPVAAGAEDD